MILMFVIGQYICYQLCIWCCELYSGDMIDTIQWRIRIGCYYGNRHCCHGSKTSPGVRHHNVSLILSVVLLILLLCGEGLFILGNNIIMIDTIIRYIIELQS